MHLNSIELKIIVLAGTLAGADFCAAADINTYHRPAPPPPPKVWADATARPANWAIRLERPGLPNFYQVTPGLYRGAQPTVQGMAELKALGIKTVLNLRSFHSVKDELQDSDLKQGRLQMNPWHAEDEYVVHFLKIVTDTNSLPVFVDCERGGDRTGMLCAMYRIVVCDWNKKEALDEMIDGGFGYNPAWHNMVRYIQKADIAKIKREAGMTPPRGSAP